MYFLNNSSFSANINKIIELKLLNYFQTENCHNQILLEQNSENQSNKNTFFNKITSRVMFFTFHLFGYIVIK